MWHILHNKFVGVNDHFHMSKFLSATKAANKLGVPQTTFSGWLQDGRVPGAMKVSNMWLIPEDISLEDIDVPKMGRPQKNGNGEKPDNV